MTAFLWCVASNVALAGCLAVCATAVTRFWRSPHLAHALWLLVLIKLVTPPIIQLPVGQLPVRQPKCPQGKPALASESSDFRSLTSEGPSASIATTVSPPATVLAATPRHQSKTRLRVALPTSGPVWLLVAWAVGTVTFVGVGLGRHMRLNSLIADGQEPDGELAQDAQQLARFTGLPACPRLRVTSAHICPFVTPGFGTPTIVLPSGLLAELDRDQIKSILAHELAHVRRRDHWVRIFGVCVLAMNWWNPVAWWASGKLQQAEEECCDAWVVWALPELRRAYGETLLSTVEYLTGQNSLAAPAGASFLGCQLERRIEVVMNRIVKPRMSLTALGFALAMGTLVLPVGASLGLATNTSEPAKGPGDRQVTALTGGAYQTLSQSAKESSKSRNIVEESDVTVSSELARDGKERTHAPRRHVRMRGIRLIPYVDVSDEDIRRLADLGEGEVLPIHSLRIGSGSITDEGVRELTRFANLTALDLSQCKGVSDRGLLHLNELHNLRSLRLDGPVGDEAARQLIFPKLEDLTLTNTLISEMAVTKLLRRLPALRSLYIDGPQFGDSTLAAIAEMDGLETLTTTVRTTDSDDAILLGSPMKSVRVSADSKQGIARLKSLGTLRQLNLTVYPSVNDEVVDQLSQLSQLEKLYMNARGFSDQHLAALKTLTNLEELSVRSASTVSAEGISRLERELPNLEVRLRD